MIAAIRSYLRRRAEWRRVRDNLKAIFRKSRVVL